MPNMLKLPALFLAVAALAACDSGKTRAGSGASAAPAGGGTAPASRDWTEVVVATPEGGFRMGNPDARVRIVEFASFTCGHCRDFHLEAEAKLKPNYVRTGQVSYEYRPFILNPWDAIAASIARCEGAERFFVWTNELYRNQDAWVQPITQVKPADIEAVGKLPADRQLIGAADAARFHDFARPRGLPRAKFEQCLAGTEPFDRLAAQRDAATATYRISGTPTFLLNGRKLEGVTTWAQLQPKIADAL